LATAWTCNGLFGPSRFARLLGEPNQLSQNASLLLDGLMARSTREPLPLPAVQRHWEDVAQEIAAARWCGCRSARLT
jgi:hypothetical protein